jgi:hypothetical protein
MKKQLHDFSLGALQAVVSTSVSMMASSQTPPTKPADFEKMLTGTSINLLRGRISRLRCSPYTGYVSRVCQTRRHELRPLATVSRSSLIHKLQY